MIASMRYLLPALLALLLTAGSIQAQGSEITDDRGKIIRLMAPPQRIISLYGAMTEIVFALEAGDRVVGVTAHESWPPEVRTLPRVGTHLNPNLEIILSLRPDLVLQGSVARGGQRAVAELEARGIPVAVFNPQSVPQVMETIVRVGILLGKENIARRLTAQMNQRLQRLEATLSSIRSRPRVFFEVSYPTLLAAGKRHLVDDLITRAGGENVIKAPRKFLRVDIELLLALDPDVYIVQKGPMNRRPGQISQRPYFSRLRAIRDGRVYIVDEFLFSRPGPRVIEALEELARILHPECFTENP